MLIGTYTEESSSKGIYLYSFNQNNADLKELNTIMSGNHHLSFYLRIKKIFIIE